MESIKIRLSSVLLAVIILMSMIMTFPVSAAEAESQDATPFTVVEDESGIHFYGPTGNNFMSEESSRQDVTVIDSVSEYNKLAGSTTDPLIRKATALPDCIDNSDSIYFPEIGNQGGLGSCLFWAQVYYHYTYAMNKMMGVPTTPENTFSPQWSYNVVTAGVDNRCYTDLSLDFMVNQGNVPMSQVPYDENYNNTYPTEEVWRNSINYRLKSYQYLEDVGTEDTLITSPNDSDLTLIKTVLNNGELLSFSTMMYGWSYTLLASNSEAPENDNYVDAYAVTSMDSQDGGHRMTIVGYNDDIWIDINMNDVVDDGEMGAFKIANSWGTDYCNEGFVWVAYDALNNESCVKGVEPNSERSSIFMEITRFELLPYGEGTDVYLKYTVNTSDRTQAKISVTAEKDCSVYTENTYTNMYYGDALAFDGSTYATDATMIFPIQASFSDVTSENFEDYTWTVNYEDTNVNGSVLAVKDAVIVDEAKGVNYSVDGVYPLELDGTTEQVMYNESKLNHAVVYYRGYYTPYISYKIDSSDAVWQKNVAVEECFENYGYTHKFVIDLEESDSATLYFSDENGNVDDNNGALFTAVKGANSYVTEGVGEPLSIKMSNDLNDVADVGRFGLFETQTVGGYQPYQYVYRVTNLTTGEEVVDEEHNASARGHYFTQEGEYKITVIVTDCAGTVVTDDNYLSIVSIPFEFTTFDAESSNKALINAHSITFTAVTNYENIGLRYGVYNKYDLVIKRGDDICYSTTIPMLYDFTDPEYMTSTVIAQWTPTQTGEYTATISATDCAGEYAEKTISFSVSDCIIGDAEGDGRVNIVDATYIQRYLSYLLEDAKLSELTADADRNGVVNILDATYIQMYLANISGVEFVGDIVNP